MKFSLFKKDPVKKAKKLVDKGDYYWEIDDLDAAASHYEKAAQIYDELGDFESAEKYYFEAARCGLELDDEEMAAKYKTYAASILMKENKAREASDIMNEVSDHFLRAGKTKESARALGVAIISAIAASDFNHAINLTKKIKRKGKSKKLDHPVLKLAEYLTKIICNGEVISESTFEKAVSKASFNDIEFNFISPVIEGARLSHDTTISIEPISSLKKVTTGKVLKFKIKITSPVPSQVISTSLPLSRNLIITKEPEFSKKPVLNEEVKFEVKSSISGSAIVGPFKITLKSDKAILHKITNSIEFEVEPPKAKVELFVDSEEYSVSTNNEFQINVRIKNMRSDSIDNILLKAEYQEGIDLSLGTSEKTIGILPGNSEMDFPFYFISSEPGEKIIMFKVFEKDRSKKPLDQIAIKIRTG